MMFSETDYRRSFERNTDNTRVKEMLNLKYHGLASRHHAELFREIREWLNEMDVRALPAFDIQTDRLAERIEIEAELRAEMQAEADDEREVKGGNDDGRDVA